MSFFYSRSFSSWIYDWTWVDWGISVSLTDIDYALVDIYLFLQKMDP